MGPLLEKSVMVEQVNVDVDRFKYQHALLYFCKWSVHDGDFSLEIEGWKYLN
jgi:hypothetical protein